MVMATGSVCQPAAGELSHEAGEASDDASEAAALHERLVAYVHALAGGPEPRSGVWVEHSYARARGPAAAAHVRVLLAPRLAPDAAALDVLAPDPAPPPPPFAEPPPADDADPDDDWEARVTALAPSAVHARLAAHALDALRRMRLERLAACPEAARAAARRLRLALAAAAAWPGTPGPRPGAWLHATLQSVLPRGVRRLYDELVGELRRAAPRLAEAALGARVAPREEPLRAVGPAREGAAGPWLVWVGSGRARADERWTRRLSALLHVRVLPAAAAAAAPDAWCAAAAGGVRAALADVLQEAGERPVVLAGAGAGAALCTALAGAARVRGLLLLAPPLLTAEGARDSPDDPLHELQLPMLLVVGSRAANCWRGAAREAARDGRGARRLLELRGADAALRLPGWLRRRRRLPQHALDAAVADECARWAQETALGGALEPPEPPPRAPPRDPPRAPPRERRRRDVRPARAAPAPERVFVADDDEDFAHLPSGAARPAPPALVASTPAGSERDTEASPAPSVTLAEGRVVSRGSGGTPLALLPPRRAPALAAADILRLPIVFADDEAPDEAAVTVRAGRAHPYARVIVASRAPRPRAPPSPRPREPPSPRPRAPPSPLARPLLLRRGLRLLPRADRPH